MGGYGGALKNLSIGCASQNGKAYIHSAGKMEGRVERDIWYMQHWSLWLDIRIIWMTIKTVFRTDANAY